jgi:hypothetical protein
MRSRRTSTNSVWARKQVFTSGDAFEAGWANG